VGDNVVRILFDEEGQPTGFKDFVTGFLIEHGMAHFGRDRHGTSLVARFAHLLRKTGALIYTCSTVEEAIQWNNRQGNNRQVSLGWPHLVLLLYSRTKACHPQILVLPISLTISNIPLSCDIQPAEMV
jgi:hypothetical protein